MAGNPPVTLDEVRTWPPTVDIPKASALFGIGRTQGYVLAASGEFPARVLRVGGKYRVVTASIIRVLFEAAS